MLQCFDAADFSWASVAKTDLQGKKEGEVWSGDYFFIF